MYTYTHTYMYTFICMNLNEYVRKYLPAKRYVTSIYVHMYACVRRRYYTNELTYICTYDWLFGCSVY